MIVNMQPVGNKKYQVHILSRHNQVEPPTPVVSDEDVSRMRMEADAARAEAARIKRELEEMRKGLPSDEQRARWAELEQQAQAAEEERLRKTGEFEGWRQQITEKHTRDLNEAHVARENEAKRAQTIESELRETLIAREFADATELFGPSQTSKTVLMPTIAKDHFGRYVEVVTHTGVDGKPERAVVVKDMHGTVIVDPKTGKPLPFAKAMNELIDAHPHKQYILRGSGRVGANNSGGLVDGEHGVDLSRLKAADFKDPKIRDAVRNKMSNSGGLQIGPGFDELARRARKS